MEEKEKCCLTCMHESLPQGIDPCNKCTSHDEWKPKEGDLGAPVAGMVWPPVAGFDPGAPEGDKTNVRLDWGETGREIIAPRVDITTEDQLKDGPLKEKTKAVAKQITRLDYAIAGVRSKMSSLGIKLTDKDLIRDEIYFTVGKLNALQIDLFELEDEREALRKAVEHGNGND